MLADRLFSFLLLPQGCSVSAEDGRPAVDPGVTEPVHVPGQPQQDHTGEAGALLLWLMGCVPGVPGAREPGAAGGLGLSRLPVSAAAA